MTDEQRLRAALHSSVPEPPVQHDRGLSARLRARRSRHHRLLTAGAAVALVVAAIPIVQGLDLAGDDDKAPFGSVSGEGSAACKQLQGRDGLGAVADSRTVDSSTASSWLRSTGSSVDLVPFSTDRSVTFCVMERADDFAVVVVGPEDRTYLGAEGDADKVGGAMQSLDELRTGGAAFTDTPFTCPHRSTPDAMDVSPTLPEGATAARICFEGGTRFTPQQVLTSGVDYLVRSINAAPISYSFPDAVCGGTASSYDYSIVFRYPAGTRVVRGETCRGIVVGSITRAVSTVTPDSRFLVLLQQQSGTPVGAVDPPPCPPAEDDSPAGVGDLRHIVAARFCQSGATGGGSVLAASQLETLRSWGDGLDQGVTQIEGPCLRPSTGWAHLALTDTWQNQFTLTVKCAAPRVLVAVLPSWTHGQMIRPLPLASRLRQLLRHLVATTP